VTKHAKTVLLAAIAAASLLVLALVGRDVYLKRQETLDCGDGPRRRIDIRDFTTQYSAYSVELEGSIGDKTKISMKLTPQQLQQLSDALQSAQEFRKYVVAGYDSCAINKTQYGKFGSRFQALDSLAHEIDALTAKPSLTQEEKTKLAALIDQYRELVGKLGKE
jgi:hypothetical protein